MKYSIINKNIVTWGLIFFALILFCGCADGLKSTKKDSFFEKWSTAAENSQGHSPSAEPKKINVADLKAKQSSSLALAGLSIKKLPSKEINLTMRQAELKAVLRAMAKSVDLNLMVKNDLKGEISVDFRGVPWDQAFIGLLRTHGLSYVWEGDIILVKTADDIEQDLKQKVQLRDIQWVEPLLPPVVINIDYYVEPKILVPMLQDFLTKDKDGKPRGSVKFDKHSNSLVISAMRIDLDKMLPIIEKIDKPTPQILIKANIVETSKNVARDLGIKWGGWNSSTVGSSDFIVTGGSGVPVGGIGGSSPAPSTQRSGFGVNFPAGSAGAGILDAATGPLGSLGLMFGKIGGNLLEVELQALQKDSKLNILSSPSITTLDNQIAFTENGQRVPFVTTTTTAGVTTQTVVFENVVMRLEITPHVIDGKNMKMKIKVVKDELDFTHAATMLGNPIIIKKLTETSLIVKDGETIVISGLTKETKGDGDTGVPWLKDVPVLGWVFKADNKNEAMEEVIIFITPHILQLSKVDKYADPVESDFKQKNGTVPEQENAGTKSESKKDLEPKQ